MFNFRIKRGQSTLEYLLVWTAIIAAFIYGTIGRGSVIQQSVGTMLRDAGNVMKNALKDDN